MNTSPEHNSYSTFTNFLKHIAFFVFGTMIVGSSMLAGVMIYAYNHGGPQSLLQFQKLLTFQPGANPQTINTNLPNGQTGQAKIYSNPALNISFVIPAEYQAKESAYGLGTTSIELRKLDNISDATSPDIQILIFPKAMGKLIGQDFDEYRAMKDNTLKQINDSQGTQMFTKLDNRTVGTLRAIDYQTISATPSTNEEPEVGTYVEAGANVLLFSTRQSNKDALEPILTSIVYPLKQQK